MSERSTSSRKPGKNIAVVGAGVAGAAIAHTLQKSRYPAFVIGSPRQGSSHTNQKWLHSGALYTSRRVILEAWQQFSQMRPEISNHVVSKKDSAMFLAIHPETIASRVARFGDRDVQASGFEWREMDPYEWVSIGLVGRTNANAGIRAKDSVIDFPALLRDLIQTLPSRQRLLDRRVISVITDTPTGSKRRVTGVLCSTSSGEKRFPCDRCVLAAGAWTPLILEESGISLKPLLIRKKCVVITFEGELVPGITVCYDITHFDPNRKQLVEADVSLVPYRGTTLAAGTGWSRLGPDVEPRGIEPTAEELEELYMELYQAFPLLWRLRSKAKPHACIKTELDTGTGPPNVLPQLFDQNHHGVEGLVVTLPGKASLMFDLADRVLDWMHSS